MKKQWKKAAGITIGIVVLILAAIYGMGIWFFGRHFLPNTWIDGANYGWMSVAGTEKDIQDQIRAFQLTIQGRDGIIDQIYGDRIDMEPVFDGGLQTILTGQNAYVWPEAFWKGQTYELSRVVSYDEGLLAGELQQLQVFQKKNIKKPQDAYISDYDETSNSYSIVPDQPGSDIIRDEAEQAIRGAIESLTDCLDLDEVGCFVEPQVKAESAWIVRVTKTLNKYVSSRIVYDWNGCEEVIDGEQIHLWLSVEDKKVVIDPEKVRGYINELAKKNDTFGKKREFVTTEGETITLASGAYGWWTNRPAETEELIAAIKKGETINREPVYRAQGYVKGQEDIGDSYVEIDLGKQHLYLYINGEVTVESDFVSGNMSRGFGTPAGIFGLTYKERNATLRGQNYATPVHYWMPFNGNVGMHDATWRKAFGGDIYKTAGSHGCVNLPKDMAAQIYDQVEKGFPVICYY